MPHVEIRMHGLWLPFGGPGAMESFADCLQKSVAKNFSCADPGGSLTPNSVDVSYVLLGEKDRQKEDVIVQITANYFSSRAKNKQKRLAAVATDVKKYVGKGRRGVTFGFWLLLPRAAWVEFKT